MAVEVGAMFKRPRPRERGITLIKSLVIVGIVAVVGTFFLGYLPRKDLRGADQFASNARNAESLISLLGGTQPNEDQCKQLQVYITEAEKGQIEMGEAGVDMKTAARTEHRFRKIADYLDSHCPQKGSAQRP
jgi:hypothetical protein